MRRLVLFLLGPTASGKSRVAYRLANIIPAEIVSADSLQIYKMFDIGTDKPPKAWRRTVPHHFIDMLDPDQEWSSGKFFSAAQDTIKKIWGRKRLPIITGGGTLYMKVMMDGLCAAPEADKDLRQKLYRLADEHGNEYLYRRLKKIDPIIAGSIHPTNLRRIIRALEVYMVSKKTFSDWQKDSCSLFKKKLVYGLFLDRKMLYNKIDERVDVMLKRGLIKEVKNIIDGYGRKGVPGLSGIGYRHVLAYLDKKYGKEEMTRLIKRDTRRYAKRQYTWWRKKKDIDWIDMGIAGAEGAVEYIKENL